MQDDNFNTTAIERTEAAVRSAKPQRFTHIGTGRGEVKMVASSRRILGDDGKVRWTRLSSSRIPGAVAAPEGVIDPSLESISFWDGESRAVAVVTYYATHPQTVALPLRDSKSEAELRALLNDAKAMPAERMRAARDLSFTLQSNAGHRIQLSRLRLGPAETVYLPGELFIEYQLAARRFLGGEGRTLGVAAYGDLGPGSIGTEIAYGQGGYETSAVSRTAPPVEGVVMDAIRQLVQRSR